MSLKYALDWANIVICASYDDYYDWTEENEKLRETKNKRSLELEDANSFAHPFTSRNFTWEMILAQWKPWLWLWNSMRQIGHCENHFINCFQDIKNALFQFYSYRIASVESLFVR